MEDTYVKTLDYFKKVGYFKNPDDSKARNRETLCLIVLCKTVSKRIWKVGKPSLKQEILNSAKYCTFYMETRSFVKIVLKSPLKNVIPSNTKKQIPTKVSRI